MKLPKHVAIIMDGNRRWAKQNVKPRSYGHKIGAENISNIVQAAIKNNIYCLSLFAFSCENWNRSKSEVNFLMKLLVVRLNDRLIKWLNKNNVSFRWCGLKDKMSSSLINKLLLVQHATETNHKIILNFCFNYGGKQDIMNAILNMNRNKPSLETIEHHLLTTNLPPVDLLIRTGGEQRISNFLLWQSAYAEIIFEKTYWPAYTPNHFAKNLKEFTKRQRRFGLTYDS